jgi:RNA polymerase sigma factor (sigma-70 family)
VPADYRVIAKIKNNRLWEAIRRRWPACDSQSEAARQLKIPASELGRLLNMQVWPYNKYRDAWTPMAEKIARALRETPEYLFDGELYGRRAQPLELLLDRPALQASGLIALPPAAPDAELAEAEGRQALDKVLKTLRPREEKVMRLRFGLDSPDGAEQSYAQIGEAFGVGRERIRQIEQSALRKLRHPTRTRPLRGLL